MTRPIRPSSLRLAAIAAVLTACASSRRRRPGQARHIANEGTVVNSAASVSAAQAAVRDVNALGGMDGHQVQLVFCNENLDPNQARACARTLISDHVMAAVGNQVVTAEPDADGILQAAGIPNVAPFSYSGYSATDANSYLIYGGVQFSKRGDAGLRRHLLLLEVGGRQDGAGRRRHHRRDQPGRQVRARAVAWPHLAPASSITAVTQHSGKASRR